MTTNQTKLFAERSLGAELTAIQLKNCPPSNQEYYVFSNTGNPPLFFSTMYHGQLPNFVLVETQEEYFN